VRRVHTRRDTVVKEWSLVALFFLCAKRHFCYQVRRDPMAKGAGESADKVEPPRVCRRLSNSVPFHITVVVAAALSLFRGTR
jgi:hypothetical protein